MEAIISEPEKKSSSTRIVPESQKETGELHLDLHDVCYYVTAGAETKHLLQNVNLHLGAGEMSALMGPSGAGIYGSHAIVSKPF